MATKKQDATPPASEPQQTAGPDPWASVQEAHQLEHMNKLKTLVFGPNGCGKSTLGALMGRPLIGVTEHQAIPLIKRLNPHAKTWLIQKPEDLQAFKKLCRVPDLAKRVDSVVLDSFTDCQRIIRTYYTDTQKSGSSTTDMKTWGLIGDATMRLARELRDLPVHTLVICLDDEENIEGEGLVHRPAISGKLKNTLGQFFNLVGYVYRKETESGLRHEVMFQGPSRFQCKPMYGINPVEPPEPSLWIQKCIDPSLKLTAEVQERVRAWLQMSAPQGEKQEEQKQETHKAESTTVQADPFAS